jgi:hypothetical protein
MKIISTAIMLIVAVILISLLLSYPMMLLWNGCLVDAVTVLEPVSWLQMWGISVLIGLLTSQPSSK